MAYDSLAVVLINGNIEITGVNYANNRVTPDEYSNYPHVVVTGHIGSLEELKASVNGTISSLDGQASDISLLAEKISQADCVFTTRIVDNKQYA